MQNDNLQKRIDRLKLLKYQEANRVMELTKKQLVNTMQHVQKQRDAVFQEHLDELQRGLTGQDGIVAQVNGTLQQAAAVKLEKKAQLYSEWDQQVRLHFLLVRYYRSLADGGAEHALLSSVLASDMPATVFRGYALVVGLCWTRPVFAPKDMSRSRNLYIEFST